MTTIKLWGWDKKPRTMLRFVKIGHVVCFEVDASKSQYGYGLLIARIPGGFVCKVLDIRHDHADDITVEEIVSARQLCKMFLLSVYSTLDRKMDTNGEWRVIGLWEDFTLSQHDIDTVFFVMGLKGMYQKKDLLGNTTPISDEEAKKYEDYAPASGDDAKIWYIKYDIDK